MRQLGAVEVLHDGLWRKRVTPGPVSTAMGDCLRAVNHLGAKPAS